MKYFLTIIALLLFSKTQAQCGLSNFCNPNNGIFSNNNTTDIAYDNMGSGFHSTYIKDINSTWRVWGEAMANDGTTNVLTPQFFNVSNYPALTGTIYKMGIGSSGAFNRTQLIVLTSTGLFVLGAEGFVLDNSLTTNNTFQKITVNGKQDGLPTNVTPADVKMMFVTSGAITITTCNGEVFVLAQSTEIRGDGGTGNATQWSQVMENATTPLTGIIVARGDFQTAFAIKNDGTLWTWGASVFLGDGSNFSAQNYAVQMTLPVGLSGVKMIQATHFSTTSYFILATDRKLYSLGENTFGVLGDGTSVDALNWVNAVNPDGSIIDDAAWISANEHDDWFDGLAVIKTNGTLLTAGANSKFMVGRTTPDDVNTLDIPNGISATDVITYAETGGHTCVLIKQGSPRYGYVGHRVNGSIGDGSSVNMTIQNYDFITPTFINVCRQNCTIPTISRISPICTGQNAVFRITAVAGDTISYNINGGASQTITIGLTNNVLIPINNAVANQILTITHLVNSDGTCNLPLSISTTIQVVNTAVIPAFTQIPSICEDDILNPLPLISNNGISGSWSPNLNNTHTTTYTFTPDTGICATQTQMTIVVFPKLNPTFTQVTPICEGTILASLPTTSNNGISGSWSPLLNNTATTTYTFTPNIGCARIFLMTIVVNKKIKPTFDPFPLVCYNDTPPVLPSISKEGISGIWQPAVINNFQSGSYQFTPNPNQCTLIPSLINITVANEFDFEIKHKCVNNNYSLSVEPLNQSFDINNAHFSWTNNGIIVNSNMPFEVSNYLISNNITPRFPLNYLATVILPNGCSKTHSAQINSIFCSIQKGISPDNDNQNDFFDLRLMNVKNLKIYNRYGIVVYNKENYTSEWTGQNDDGQELPAGVYYFVIDFNEEKPAAVGWIYINREN